VPTTIPALTAPCFLFAERRNMIPAGKIDAYRMAATRTPAIDLPKRM
jgi:hypothetical protein